MDRLVFVHHNANYSRPTPTATGPINHALKAKPKSMPYVSSKTDSFMIYLFDFLSHQISISKLTSIIQIIAPSSLYCLTQLPNSSLHCIFDKKNQPSFRRQVQAGRTGAWSLNTIILYRSFHAVQAKSSSQK